MKKFQVIIDPDLEPILPRYMEIQFRELVLLEDALASGDSEAVRMLGHKLKGSGSSFGFNDLTVMGEAIENAAKTNDLDTARTITERVRSYLENVDVVYGTGD